MWGVGLLDGDQLIAKVTQDHPFKQTNIHKKSYIYKIEIKINKKALDFL